MIEDICTQNKLEELLKVFDIYSRIKDDREIINIGGKIVQCDDDLIDKPTAENIFDTLYQIFSKRRKTCRDILQIEAIEEKKGNRRKLKAIRDYKVKMYGELSEMLSKLVVNIQKGVRNTENKNKELECFLQFNLADYRRYLAEVTLDPIIRRQMIEQTEQCYLKLFELLEAGKVNTVHPSFITAKFHYSIFLFEVKETKVEAIKYLKGYRFDVINLLDTMFKNFIDSYELLDLITTTLTNWVIVTNYKEDDTVN